MSFSGAELSEQIQALKSQRKERAISERDFYLGLVTILGRLADSLTDEVQISAADVKKQIPLLLVFLEDQLQKLVAREE